MEETVSELVLHIGHVLLSALALIGLGVIVAGPILIWWHWPEIKAAFKARLRRGRNTGE